MIIDQWDKVMLVQLAAQFFVLVTLELFSIEWSYVNHVFQGDNSNNINSNIVLIIGL